MCRCSSKRERNIRNGFANIRGGLLQAALSLKPSILAEALTHPGWIVEYMRARRHADAGELAALRGAGANAEDGLQVQSRSMRAGPRPDLAGPRTLSPAVPAQSGRQRASWTRATRCAPPRSAATASSCRTTAAASSTRRRPRSTCCRRSSAAVGDKLTVMLDSGVRRGADILIALCLGAQFCFMGRPTLYGAVAGGMPGVKKAIDDLPQRDRPRDGPDRLPEPRPARPRFPVAGGSGAQCVTRFIVAPRFPRERQV